MLPIRSDSSRRARFEDLFFEHYPRLTEWALQLTRGNRWESDDLVQELYVQLIRSSVDIAEIRRPEDYLFSVLRNLQYARFRRCDRNAIDNLSIVDYDSIEGGLMAVDRNKLLFVRADLQIICDFVCERKNSSRTASVLILRFFRGYFPSEVMAVTRSTRAAVDTALRVARREAKLALERPGFLANIGSTKKLKTVAADIHDNPFSLFQELREKIASACAGECFEQETLKSRYASENDVFSVEELAHLVSCTICLDEANTILGLPLLKDRSLDDTLGRDNSSGTGMMSGEVPKIVSRRNKRAQAGGDMRWAKAERRAREIDEHRPQRLQIAVDGEIRASQRVTAALNELHAKLQRHERPAFIEVLSEQGVCLAFLLVIEPNMGSGLERSESLALSDGRLIELTISCSGDTPMVSTDYRDPQFGEVREPIELQLQEHAHCLDSDLHDGEPVGSAKRASLRFSQRTVRLLSRWKRTVMPEFNLMLACAVVLGTASVVCFLLWTQSASSRISADTLLQRAQSWDNSGGRPVSPGVIYQRVQISTSGQTMERTIYRDMQRKRRPKGRSIDAQERQIKVKLVSADIDWDEPLSVANFKQWHDGQGVVRDSIKRTGQGLLTLTTKPSLSGPIVQESFTVRDSDFHPVERNVALRDGGIIEIAELDYVVVPWDAANNNWFEPLSGPSAAHAPQINYSLHPHFPVPLSEMQLDEAELNVRLALNQMSADTEERISVRRQSSGLRVTGIVATEERKEEIEGRLAAIPHVFPSIFTFDELKNEPVGSHAYANETQVISSSDEPSPLEDYLEHRNWKREEAQRLSEQLLDASVSINQDSRAISELLQSFDSRKQLTPASERSLSELLGRRRERLRAAIAMQQNLLLQLGDSSLTVSEEPGQGNLADYAEQNLTLCKGLLRRNSDSQTAAEALLKRLIGTTKQLEALSLRTPTPSSGVNSDSTVSREQTQPTGRR